MISGFQLNIESSTRFPQVLFSSNSTNCTVLARTREVLFSVALTPILAVHVHVHVHSQLVNVTDDHLYLYRVSMRKV